MKHRTLTAAVVTAAALAGVAGCSSSADVASNNLSKEADQFQVFRQIVVYNTFTDKYVMEVDGYCSLGNNDPTGEVSYTCKTPAGFTKDIVHVSDNALVWEHQLHPKNVSTDYFKVILKPSTVVPNVQVSE